MRPAEVRVTRSWRAALLGLVVALVGFEAGARVLFALRQPPPLTDLQPYQMQDPKRPWHRLLRPGFVQTYAEAIASKREAGRVLGEQYLSRAGADSSGIFLRINREGFRGPEVDRTHAAPRIVTVGDSCTFGMGESSSYPRMLEMTLRERGIAVEIVNAGVEGYTPADALLELDRIEALHPDVATIYLGWNAIFDEEQVFGHPVLASWRLIRGASARLSRSLQGDSRAAALDAYTRPKHPDRDARELAGLREFVPMFLPDIRQIVRALHSSGSRVVLLTLPGLYELDKTPTDYMLKIGHLPIYTDNPYELAALSARLNALLRQLASEESVQLIDVESWSRTAFRPRERYFFDSVHFTDEGQAMLGRFLADQIQPILSQ
jgi:lysophospholipase L1-like esterase